MRGNPGLNKLFKSASFKKERRWRWYQADLYQSVFSTTAACYVFLIDGRVVYVGSTNNMSVRMRQHRNKFRTHQPFPVYQIRVKYRPSKKYGDWAMLELRLLRRLCPCGNTKMIEVGV